MRHQVGVRKLGKTPAHRRAMLRNMVTSLLRHERITTTAPKAKEAKPSEFYDNSVVEEIAASGFIDQVFKKP